MKRSFLFIFVPFFVVGNMYSQTNPQWDFYFNVIPKQNNIVVSGSSPVREHNITGTLDWRLTIDDKYNVRFSGTFKADRWHTNPPMNRGSDNPIRQGNRIILRFYEPDVYYG